MREPLRSTGLPPHFSVAIDKSTPNRDTNQAIMVIMPYDGFRISMPVDAPLVYESSEDGNITGGTGQDLAEQVVDILTKKLHLSAKDLSRLRGRVYLLTYRSIYS